MGHVLQIVSSPVRDMDGTHRHFPAQPKTPLRFPSPPEERHNPFILWHLLSLDAPTVAVVWTGFLAHSNGVRLPPASLAAMFVAVWLLYAGDRLLDTRPSTERRNEHRPRHTFHARHRRPFLTGILASVLLLAVLLPLLPPASIHLYLVEGSLLAGYFLLIHAGPAAPRLFKECAVGVFFAAATFIPTVSRMPSLRVPMLVPAALLAALCTLNCLFIFRWEHTGEPCPAGPANPARPRLHPFAAALLVASLLSACLQPPAARTIAGAVAAATSLLLALDACRHRVPATPLRAAADLALLTPILFLAFP